MKNLKKIKIVDQSSRLKIKNTQTPSSGGSPCPSITLNDLSSDICILNGNPFGGTTYVQSIVPTGGTGPYNLISNDLPSGFELSNGIFGWTLSAVSPLPSFGIHSFHVSGTDANGCPITEREYTVLVGQAFTETGGGDEIYIDVSGLPSTYGTNVFLRYIVINGTATDLSTTYCVLYDPGGVAYADIWNTADLNGAEITAANIYSISTGYPELSAGSSPYAGNFDALTNYNTAFHGISVNGLWRIAATDVLFGECKLIFMPI